MIDREKETIRLGIKQLKKILLNSFKKKKNNEIITVTVKEVSKKWN